MEDADFRKAQKKVQAKKGFYIHLISFVAMGIFFFLMNFFTFSEGAVWWFFFPMLPWGAGLLIHYGVVFGIPGTKIMSEEWEEEQLDNEINRLRRLREKRGIKNNLLEEGSMEPDALDLKKLDKKKEILFDEEDLV